MMLTFRQIYRRVPQRIADAKGVGQSVVAERIKYNLVSDEVKQLCSDGFLTEGHLDAIMLDVQSSELAAWLTSEQVTLELANKIKHDADKVAY
ncbi:MAG: hypothetical protein AAF267_19285 [Deinococcota bacterium]